MQRRYAPLSILGLFLTASIIPAIARAGSEVTAPETAKHWTWRKSFKNSQLHDLVMNFNGTRIGCGVTFRPAKDKGAEVFVVSDNASAVVYKWENKSVLAGISVDGAGDHAVTLDKSGVVLRHDTRKQGAKPEKLAHDGAVIAFAPNGAYAAIARKDEKTPVRVYDATGKIAWPVPDTSGTGLRLAFPFLENPDRLLGYSSDGKVFVYEKDKLLWKAELAPVRTFASTLNEKGTLAFATESDEIVLFGPRGQSSGRLKLSFTADVLACGDTGTLCAASGAGKEGSILTVFDLTGKELWRYRKKGKGRTGNVAVAAHGEMVLAGFEQDDKWAIHAWDKAGKPLWTAPIEGGLVDFRVSWNGKRIAAITGDGRLVYFDMTEKKKDTPTPIEKP